MEMKTRRGMETRRRMEMKAEDEEKVGNGMKDGSDAFERSSIRAAKHNANRRHRSNGGLFCKFL